jgi:hypothetical protein
VVKMMEEKDFAAGTNPGNIIKAIAVAMSLTTSILISSADLL